MKIILECIKGIAIGAGAILPGLSSGVLCVTFGIYEKLLDSVLNFFSDIKNNIRFLLPILFGIGIGVILFGNILKFLFENFEMQTKFCFIGIILGGIPSLIKTANSKKGFKLQYVLYTLLSFAFTTILIFLENNNKTSSVTSNADLMSLIIAGFTMSARCCCSWN